MGLLSRSEEDGTYTLLKEVKVDVLQPFITVGSRIIPRLFTYAVVISILFLYLILFVLPSDNFAELGFFSVSTGLVALVGLWYETARSWRSTPR